MQTVRNIKEKLKNNAPNNQHDFKKKKKIKKIIIILIIAFALIVFALIKGGMLAFEVGINEDRKVAEILKTADFKNITVTKDFNGINRVVTAIK